MTPGGSPGATPTPVRPARFRPLRSGYDARRRRRRLLTYVLLAGSTILMVHALVGDQGYLATLRARVEHAALVEALDKVRGGNDALREDIRRLREEPAAVEAEARRALGMARPGETVVILRDARPAGSAPQTPAPTPASGPR